MQAAGPDGRTTAVAATEPASPAARAEGAAPADAVVAAAAVQAPRRRAPRPSRTTAARGFPWEISPLAAVPTAELVAEIDRRRRRSAQLMAEADRLRARIAQIDAELEALDVNAG